MRARFGGARQFLVTERHQPFCFLWLQYPDHAGAVAGQRDKDARSLRCVKFGRNVVVGTGMADVECQRRLMKFAAVDRNARGLPAERVPAIGANRRARRYRSAAGQLNRDDIIASANRSRLVVESRQICQRSGPFFQRRHQNAVLDVIPEHIEADLVAGKLDLRRPDEATGVVDQPHDAQLGGLVLAVRPHLKRLQKIDRSAEKRCRPVIGINRSPGNQRRGHTGLRHRNGRCQPCGSATDHGNVIGRGMIAHAPDI